jgi:hypothetical protein
MSRTRAAAQFMRGRFVFAGVVLAGTFASTGANSQVDAINTRPILLTLSLPCRLDVLRVPHLAPAVTLDSPAERCTAMAASPANRLLAVSNANGDVVLRRVPDLAVTAQGRLAGETDRMMFSADGRYLIGLSTRQALLVVADVENLAHKRTLQLKNRDRIPLMVRVILLHRKRQSLMLSFENSTEIWEVFFAPDAAPVFEGLVHDYRMQEAVAEVAELPVRRIRLDHQHGGAMFLLGDQPELHFWTPTGRSVLNLDVRRITVGTYRQLDSPAEACAVLPLGEAQLALIPCPGEHDDLLAFVNRATGEVEQLRQPVMNRRPAKVATDDVGNYRAAVMPGHDGRVVLYDRMSIGRLGEASVSGLLDAWLYP